MQRLLFQFGGLVLAMFALVHALAPPPEEADTAGASAADAVAPAASQDAAFDPDTTVIDRDRTGQFHLVAQINGEATKFLVDTGADVVALTVEDAQRIGLDVNDRSFQPILKTASGVGYGAPVQLELVEVGETALSGVDGVVIEGLGVNLLGQSVLRRLGKVELQGDRMVIHHQ